MSKKIINKPNPVDPKILELQDKLARSMADYANLEKRIDSQRQLFVTLATVSIISKMIEVLDDLYLSQTHLNDPGLKITIDKFFNVLKSEGLEEIKAESAAFDPNTMECVSTLEGEDNLVLSVHRRGYTLNGQVIRPSQVIVGKNSTIINS
jgi:molecular chaperone GrpE